MIMMSACPSTCTCMTDDLKDLDPTHQFCFYLPSPQPQPGVCGLLWLITGPLHRGQRPQG